MMIDVGEFKGQIWWFPKLEKISPKNCGWG